MIYFNKVSPANLSKPIKEKKKKNIKKMQKEFGEFKGKKAFLGNTRFLITWNENSVFETGHEKY